MVTYQPGTVQAVATKGGKAWANVSISTSGTPASLTLAIERPITGETVHSDGQDVALLRVSIHDSNGNIVRNVNNTVTFTVTSGQGRVIGTGNGDPVDHTQDQSNQRMVFNGLARAVIGANKNSASGSIVVQASSPGLQSASVTINTAPPAWNWPEI